MSYLINYNLDKNKWSSFVQNHPHGNIFQTPEIFEVYELTKKIEPFFVAVMNDDDEVEGVLIAGIQKEHSGFLGIFSARSVIDGGPLVKDNNIEVLELILKEYKKTVKRKAIYSLFRNFWNWKDNEKEIFHKTGFEYEDHFNILINLKKSNDELWSEVHTKRRNEIRRAIKEGTKFNILNDKKDLKATYKILKEVYQRAGLPLHSQTFFETVYEKLGLEHFKIFIAQYEGEIIGTMFTLCFNNTIYDWYAGSYKEYYKKYPNDLIPWHVFLWGKENGYKTFDFGGAGKPDKPYGVRDYKLKFGGELANIGRFELIHNKWLMAVGRLGMFLYKKTKKIFQNKTK
ncbi:MAG: peptidoglycan bridge formation glycyltransferase FemA/FemB family protein [Bacteroidales bacterium]|nr:peptidoglycan bridge formation glycyltransferase FemA/FemB family protein [Bacteroidales bacterium]